MNYFVGEKYIVELIALFEQQGTTAVVELVVSGVYMM